METVAICIATCGRPEGLDRLLASLAQLTLAKCPDVGVTVLVADNHPEKMGHDIAQAWEKKLPFPLEYDHEPRRGLAFVRNKLVAMGRPYDFLAFVDDDEIVRPDWLDELLDAQRNFQADVVQGFMIIRYENPPAWLSVSPLSAERV